MNNCVFSEDHNTHLRISAINFNTASLRANLPNTGNHRPYCSQYWVLQTTALAITATVFPIQNIRKVSKPNNTINVTGMTTMFRIVTCHSIHNSSRSDFSIKRDNAAPRMSPRQGISVSAMARISAFLGFSVAIQV